MLKLRAGDRLRVIRELMGLTRDEFAELLKMDYVRLRNVEQKRAKVSEFEYEQAGKLFPELIPYFAYEGDIVVSELAESEQELCRLMAAKIEAGQIPRGFYVEEKIK
ncbi:helix-turn-helix domain-containing protein [Microbulbifer sp. OS29]|uniref:Helix-turn-helix domain-containing protein n=1 Tax=Microbulbifer okhotskensis TaxID=2926617 RepID=A0A9X2EUZ9_9GAMM|nr:helix-turn-helix transcriptional regulator [Microbulbifer okhotskensis]MCO1336003.1 helix-turn-helix domain-containing protein [Microbulbifer okhotskensis]